ncbi:hypothetical protein T492DRAFT_1146277 [Pavlovales sp. CCMP2436]|nr:hypothetical protein T492DRAFT_1146277 [Pavlovales sp. CCMP2436]
MEAAPEREGGWEQQFLHPPPVKLYCPSDRVSQWRAAQLELMRSTLPGATATANQGHRGRLPSFSPDEALRKLSRPSSRSGMPAELRGLGQPGSHPAAEAEPGRDAGAFVQQVRPSTSHGQRPRAGLTWANRHRVFASAAPPPRTALTRPTSAHPFTTGGARPPSASSSGSTRRGSARALPERELEGLGAWAAELRKLRPDRTVSDSELEALWAHKAKAQPARSQPTGVIGTPPATAFGVRLGSAYYSTLSRPLSGLPAVRLLWALGAALEVARESDDRAAEEFAWDSALADSADALGGYAAEWGELLHACRLHFATQLREGLGREAQLHAEAVAAEEALRSRVAGGSAQTHASERAQAGQGGLLHRGASAAARAAEREGALALELAQMRNSLNRLEASSVHTMPLEQRLAVVRATVLELDGAALADLAAELLARCDAPGRQLAASSLPPLEQLALATALGRSWPDELSDECALLLYAQRTAAGKRGLLGVMVRSGYSRLERAQAARECVRAQEESGQRLPLLLELLEKESSDRDKRELLAEMLRGPLLRALGQPQRRELLGTVLEAMAADEVPAAAATELRARLQPRALAALAAALLVPAAGSALSLPASLAALLVEHCALPAAAVAEVFALALSATSNASDAQLAANAARALHALAAATGEGAAAAAAEAGGGARGGGEIAGVREAAARLVLGALSRDVHGEILPTQPLPPPRPPPAHGAAALLRAAASIGSLADAKPAALVAALFAELDSAGRAEALAAMTSGCAWGEVELETLVSADTLAPRLAEKLAARFGVAEEGREKLADTSPEQLRATLPSARTKSHGGSSKASRRAGPPATQASPPPDGPEPSPRPDITKQSGNEQGRRETS